MDMISNWFRSRTWQWWTRYGIGIGQFLATGGLLVSRIKPGDAGAIALGLLVIFASGFVCMVCVIDDNNMSYHEGDIE